MQPKTKGKQWERVVRTPIPFPEKKRQDRNKLTLTSPQFLKACKLVSVAPTTRQASKWNMKKGSAWKATHA